ncbi:MAG: hypothetical protein PHO04_00770 [Candidatus Pacebacteria bacterium]|jgi:hypothetical protein|nr:hypothetical protein [Candidatus Paceibacterota bacterium]NMB47562.1 hypothetical protein [Patescibacteria group bacterium]MDD2796448.1 hypothetical protein [Candidatus Paceibacterota bacterium]MDD3047834.1 hypothetical protein [Candidatus Paceibacterota bacterium]MDD3509680.1 hypothetical protein [Candidatus Paceibacterota bacterium]
MNAEKGLAILILVLIVMVIAMVEMGTVCEWEIIQTKEFKLFPVTYNSQGEPIYYGKENNGRGDSFFVYVKNNEIEKLSFSAYRASVIENSTEPILKIHFLIPTSENKLHNLFLTSQPTEMWEIHIP